MRIKQLCLAILIIGSINLHAQLKPKQPFNDKISINKEKLVKNELFTPKSKVLNNPVDFSNYSNLDLIIQPSSSFKVDKWSEKGEVEWMTGKVAQEKSYSLDQKADRWLKAAAAIMKTDPKLNKFVISATWQDNLGQDHIRLNQFHRGIKVYGSEILLHANEGVIVSQNGQYTLNKYLPEVLEPQINEDQAKDIVKKQLRNYHADWNKLKGLGIELNVDRWESELVIYNHENTYYLAYHLSVYPNLGEHFEYFIDAINGETIHYFSTICAAHNHADFKKETPVDGPAVALAKDLFGTNRVINTYIVGNDYFMIDGSRSMFSLANSVLPDDPVGSIWTINLNNTSPINSNAEYTHLVTSSNIWNSTPEAVSAHYNGGTAYEYYKETFSRESISGTGQNIISFVNVADEDGSSLGNAFWNGLGIYYGNGDNAFHELGRGLDVAGHEMSHGVVQASANLEYYGESGAMNESFADVFGVMIDRDDWLIGEDVVRQSVFPSGALRNMADPHNGAQTGDFGRGWQPNHVNEKYNGSEDNNGVHINSGIPNHAFYLFATQVGKEQAEQVYYHALTNYLTRSSGFKELRFAIVKSAGDLYGSTTASMAGQAFDQVGILDAGQGDFEEDLSENPGLDLLLVSDQNKSNLLVFDLNTGEAIFDPLTTVDQLSKPSITDDGSRIVFVGTDNHIYLIDINWGIVPPTAQIVQASYSPDWRNAVISKDGNRIALLDLSYTNKIFMLDIPSDSENEYTLFNPTYSDGVGTGDVIYADAMEFDLSGSTLIYDAINEVSGANSGSLEYWDIGFLEVWNNTADTWALGRIDKLFGALPEGLSVGNPTFSKNSPYIIAMDFLDGNFFSILGVNIETGEVGEIFSNSTVGYPNYSRDDEFLIYDLDFLSNIDLGFIELNSDKITSVTNSDNILGADLRWGVWFSNGTRQLDTGNEEIIEDSSLLNIAPNPAADHLRISLSSNEIGNELQLEVSDIIGKLILTENVSYREMTNYNLNISSLEKGSYILTLRSPKSIISKKFVKE